MIALLYLESVSCQIIYIKGFATEEVLLPCTYNDSQLEIRNVFWRDESDNIVLDIKDLNQNLNTPDEKYRGRVFSFPDEYKVGNFSISMKNLQLMDTDMYRCFIHTAGVNKLVNLTVSVKPNVGPTTSPPSDGDAGMNHLHLPLLAAAILTGLALKVF